MQASNPKITILLILLLLLFLHAEGKNLVRNNAIQENNPTNSSTYSPWLTGFRRPRPMGCRWRPWICDQQEGFPRVRRRCCRNRCVDVASDVNNCGLCGIRCPFNWLCCRGLCRNINISPFHCGRCEHRCKFPSFCFGGMCGYAQPFPFPFPPRPPKPCPPRPSPPKAFSLSGAGEAISS